MDKGPKSLVIEPERENHAAIEFCQKFLRHYTEGVTETVMFLIPQSVTQ